MGLFVDGVGLSGDGVGLFVDSVGLSGDGVGLFVDSVGLSGDRVGLFRDGVEMQERLGDLVAWVQHKLPEVPLDPGESADPGVALDPEESAEHKAAAAEVEEELRKGHYITAEHYFAGVRNPR